MVKKIYTKEKRMLVMQGRRGRNRAVRPKTFKTEKSADDYAKEQGIKKYSLKQISSTKIKIIEEI